MAKTVQLLALDFFKAVHTDRQPASWSIASFSPLTIMRRRISSATAANMNDTQKLTIKDTIVTKVLTSLTVSLVVLHALPSPELKLLRFATSAT